MTQYNYRIVPYSGEYLATVDEFPRLSAFGKTPSAALAELEIVLSTTVEIYEEEGWKLPKPYDTDLVLAEAARRLRQLQVVTVDNHDGTYTHSVSVPIGDNGWLTEADKAADDQLNFGTKIDAHN